MPKSTSVLKEPGSQENPSRLRSPALDDLERAFRAREAAQRDYQRETREFDRVIERCARQGITYDRIAVALHQLEHGRAAAPGERRRLADALRVRCCRFRRRVRMGDV